MLERWNARPRAGRSVVCGAVLLATLAMASGAGATSATIDDDAGDVTSLDTGDAMTEPRVDILDVHVTSEARLLEITVHVAQLTPLDDEAWDGAHLQLNAVLADEDDERSWFWSFDVDGGSASGQLVDFSAFEEDFDSAFCDTAASIDEAASSYVLSADASCLERVPRAIRVGVSMAYDAHPDDPEFLDIPTDSAPDDDVSDVIGSSGGPGVTRLAGIDRIATAVAVSADAFDEGSAHAAVLVSSLGFADSLAGAPLATDVRGPLLLTGGTGVDARVMAELVRAVEPGADVFLLGGTGALGDAIVTELREHGFRPRRLAGATRFDTAVAVADEIGDHELTMVVDGRSQREGLIAAAAAASLGGVVVLSDGGHLPKASDDFLANDAARHVAIGRAGYAAPGAERIAAASAAELSQKVLDRLLPDVATIGVVSQDAIVGSLPAAPHLGSLHGGLLLTDGRSLSPAVAAELRQRAASLREVVLYGGTGALSAGVADAVTVAVQ